MRFSNALVAGLVLATISSLTNARAITRDESDLQLISSQYPFQPRPFLLIF